MEVYRVLRVSCLPYFTRTSSRNCNWRRCNNDLCFDWKVGFTSCFQQRTAEAWKWEFGADVYYKRPRYRDANRQWIFEVRVRKKVSENMRLKNLFRVVWLKWVEEIVKWKKGTCVHEGAQSRERRKRNGECKLFRVVQSFSALTLFYMVSSIAVYLTSSTRTLNRVNDTLFWLSRFLICYSIELYEILFRNKCYKRSFRSILRIITIR